MSSRRRFCAIACRALVAQSPYASATPPSIGDRTDRPRYGGGVRLRFANGCPPGGDSALSPAAPWSHNRHTQAQRRRLSEIGLIDRDTVVEFGYVSRMDVLQAEILRYRLPRLGRTIAIRKRNAAVYRRSD